MLYHPLDLKTYGFVVVNNANKNHYFKKNYQRTLNIFRKRIMFYYYNIYEYKFVQ